MYYGWWDPTYILVIVGMLITMIASSRVQSIYAKYSRVRAASGMTAMQAARSILDDAGLYDVEIQRIGGNLTDNYDPRSKVLHLSQTTYDSTSVAAIGVAAHECGHAIQDARNYAPLRIRGAIVPAVNFAAAASWPVILIGVLLSWNHTLIMLGILLFCATVAFHLITLPVELDASHRALQILEGRHMLYPDELSGARNVLRAAAMTYVAAAAASLLQLLRLLMLFNRRD